MEFEGFLRKQKLVKSFKVILYYTWIASMKSLPVDVFGSTHLHFQKHY